VKVGRKMKEGRWDKETYLVLVTHHNAGKEAKKSRLYYQAWEEGWKKECRKYTPSKKKKTTSDNNCQKYDVRKMTGGRMSEIQHRPPDNKCQKCDARKMLPGK
jgi:hypothetical protein